MAELRNYQMRRGLDGAEEITDFRQTASCFNAHEVNPAIGCEFRCRYCSMYAQMNPESHSPLTIYADYPAYLRSYIEQHPRKERLIFNLSPKTEIFSPALIESGVTEDILSILCDLRVRYYVITKGALPPEPIRRLLVRSRSFNQIIVSSGLPDGKTEKLLEPAAPSSEERMQFALWANGNGIVATGLVAPYLPTQAEREYAEALFARYRAAKIKHASLQVLKVSLECLERMCRLLPMHESKLRQVFDKDNIEPIVWTLPGNKKVTRYYANSAYLRKELTRLKQVAARYEITVSACTDVCKQIGDPLFNKEGLSKGFNCVGFTRAKLSPNQLRGPELPGHRATAMEPAEILGADRENGKGVQ